MTTPKKCLVYLLCMIYLVLPASAYLQEQGEHNNFYTLDAAGQQTNQSEYQSTVAMNQLAAYNQTSGSYLIQEGVLYGIFGRSFTLAFQIITGIIFVTAILFFWYAADNMSSRHWPIQMLLQLTTQLLVILALAYLSILAIGDQATIINTQYRIMIWLFIALFGYVILWIMYQMFLRSQDKTHTP